ncbi:MAG: B12-binding domain-containing protein, partial [Candidatus Tectomicrobia bacterium]|nr:B12-binding domain-containing protein [Candidatus Tectomicrobia bacterium]
MADLRALAESLEQGKVAAVQGLIQQALEEGHSPAELLDLGLLEGMRVIGE